MPYTEKDNRAPCARCNYLVNRSIDYYRVIGDIIFCEHCVNEYVKSIDDSSIKDTDQSTKEYIK